MSGQVMCICGCVCERLNLGLFHSHTFALFSNLSLCQDLALRYLKGVNFFEPDIKSGSSKSKANVDKEQGRSTQSWITVLVL